MEFIKKHMFGTIFLIFSIIVLVCFAVNLYIVWKPSIDASNMHKAHMTDEYNNGEVVYWLDPYAPLNKGIINTVPWGIEKLEVKQLEQGLLLEETDNRLIFGPSEQTGAFRKNIFVEYHFNKQGRLYKVVEASGLKYVYVEDNPQVAEAYRELLKNSLINERYGSYDSKINYFEVLGSEYTISWKDNDSNERTVTEATSEGMISEIIKNLADIDVDIDLLYLEHLDYGDDYWNVISDNDLVITRYNKVPHGKHVAYKHVIQKINDELVLGEGTLINTLLED